jgi:hypothetical protein
MGHDFRPSPGGIDADQTGQLCQVLIVNGLRHQNSPLRKKEPGSWPG